MAQCGYCGTTILFGGVRDGAYRFCNNKCHQNAYVLRVAQAVPADVLERQTEEVFRGNCPKCRGLGPVDIHKVHRVWSALLLTSWSSSQQVSCRSCATKSQLGGALFSLGLGWCGAFPGDSFLPLSRSPATLSGCAPAPIPLVPPPNCGNSCWFARARR